MKKPKFTEGKWHIWRRYNCGVSIIPYITSSNPYPQVVADVYPSIPEDPDRDAVQENLFANAQLIAAAPQMFELVRYLAQMQSCEFKPKDKEESEHLLHILSRATFMAKLLYGKVTDDYSQDIPLEEEDES